MRVCLFSSFFRTTWLIIVIVFKRYYQLLCIRIMPHSMIIGHLNMIEPLLRRFKKHKLVVRSTFFLHDKKHQPVTSCHLNPLDYSIWDEFASNICWNTLKLNKALGYELGRDASVLRLDNVEDSHMVKIRISIDQCKVRWFAQSTFGQTLFSLEKPSRLLHMLKIDVPENMWFFPKWDKPSI